MRWAGAEVGLHPTMCLEGLGCLCFGLNMLMAEYTFADDSNFTSFSLKVKCELLSFEFYL